MAAKEVMETPSAQPADEVMGHYEVAGEKGLSDSEAQSRLDEYGPNKLREAQSRSAWEILIEQFKSIVIVLLVIAAVASLAFGDVVVAMAILVAIIINTVIGFFTELRAVRSMESLRELSSVEARVRREGELREIDAEQIVPGDILLLDSGDIITADARVIESANLRVDEAPLTGESVPVSKQVEPVETDTDLAERASMLYKGTTVTGGSGEAVVVATGMDTELGRISELVEEAESETTPLEQRLNRLGGRLAWISIALAIVLGGAGLLAGREVALMVETAVSLAVAAIPEGLPIVATVALARGMKRMADRNALVDKLETVETLGATNLIMTDKTGTLTESEMRVTHLDFDDEQIELDNDNDVFSRASTDKAQNNGHGDGAQVDPHEDERLNTALRIGVLCSNATLPNKDDEDSAQAGEPLELALLWAARSADMERDALLEEWPEEHEVAFNRETSMMATYHQHDDGYYVAVKGAPEAVLEACTQIAGPGGETRDMSDDDRQKWRDRNDELAASGLRMLALAHKMVSSTDAEPYEDLTFVALTGLLDPPREEIPDVIAECHHAGIRVVMITGDQAETARNVALEIGLVDVDDDEQATVIKGRDMPSIDDMSDEDRRRIEAASIFARATPEQKLDLITLHQDGDKRVAMTGDGVNDAPALQKADIGIAMGQRGTPAAREAADMVLQDDRFATILVAVEQGRIIFGNIRKFIMYLLAGNLGQIGIVGVAALFNTPLPLRPLVILYLNVIIDIFPALALGVGEGSRDVMDNPPRDPQEPILTRSHWLQIVGYALGIGGAALAVYAYTLLVQQRADDVVFTLTYLTVALARVWHVFNVRDNDSGIFRNEVTQNKWVWGAVLLSLVMIAISIYLPGLNTILGTVPPTAGDWLLVLGASLGSMVVIQIGKVIATRVAGDS